VSHADASLPPEHRLHPWSWLFVLLQQLRQFVVPLLALLVAGRRDTGPWEYAGYASFIGVAVLVAISILQYFTYRYRIGRDGISVRTGLLRRDLRQIPYARIHNVVLHQGLLHRLFGVAEVRLEAAGGQKPEAQMRVLGLDRALELEQAVRDRGAAPLPAEATAPAPCDPPLLALSTAEVVRLGLVSNRGMIVFAAGLGLVWQVFPEKAVAGLLQDWFRGAMGYAGALHLGWLAMAAGVLAFAAAFVLVLRLLSVVLALVQYHGFRLVEHQGRLTVERGLLARVRTSVAPRRIQAWHLEETLLHRWFGRRSLRIDTAVGGQENDPRRLRELAPIAPPETCDALLRYLVPQLQWPPQWKPLPRRAWWRLFAANVPWNLLLAAVLCWHFGAWGLLVLAWLPWSAYAARRQAGWMGYAVDARLVAVRGGWWSRWWRMAEVDKIQALRLQRSPLDRWLGTASLLLDTAGAGAMAPPLRIRFLPEAEARALQARLARMLAARRLRW